MKIGLLTFHTSNNYGALLQVYATLQVLKRMGHDCEIVNLRRRPKNKIISYIYNQLCNRNFYLFRKSYLLPQTEQFYAGDDLTVLNKRYDCFLVGSDQVWRTRFTGDLALYYFLDFVDDENLKVAYSSSFGVGDWTETPELTPAIKRLLARFNAVAVREDSGVQICENVFGVNAEHVLDPTLLLEEQDYEHLFSDVSFALPPQNAVTFLLDGKLSEFEKNIHDIIQKVKGIPSISLSIPKISFQGKSIDWRPRNVSEWLYTLKESEYVITESFHCVAFAIIFKKKFICVVNHRRGKARLESFLGMLGLSDFLIEKEHCTEEKITELISRSINYDQISKNLQEKKESSIQFLGKALNCQL